jgi:hypothetical protein
MSNRDCKEKERECASIMTTRRKRKTEEAETVICPAAVQVLTGAFLDAARIYERETGRGPAPEEMEILIRLALEGREEDVFSGMEGTAVSDCKLKTKKKTRTAGPKPGDVYAVPLLGGKVYGYVMIVKGTKPSDDLYLELLRLFSKKALTAAEMKKKKEREAFLTVCADWTPILSGMWKKVCSLPFDEKTYNLPDFYGYTVTFFGNSRLYYISRGKANDPDVREVGVTQEEAEAVRNPDGTHGAEQIADWLYQEFLKAGG